LRNILRTCKFDEEGVKNFMGTNWEQQKSNNPDPPSKGEKKNLGPPTG